MAKSGMKGAVGSPVSKGMKAMKGKGQMMGAQCKQPSNNQ